MSTNTMVSVALLVLLVCWTVGAYNRLVRLKNVITHNFAPVDGQITHRHELVVKLTQASALHLAHEWGDARDALNATVEAREVARAAADLARARPHSAKAVRRLANAERRLTQEVSQLLTLIALEPQLAADPMIASLKEELTSVESTSAFTRQSFNEAVKSYNEAQGQFPTVLVARLFGYGPSALLSD